MAYYDALMAKWPSLSGTTQQKLDAINALMVSGPSAPVPVLQVMTYLRTNNLWLPIKSAAAAGTSAGAAAAVDYNADPRVQTIDFSLAIVRGMLSDLVTHSLLSQAQSDALVAMSFATVTWCQANGYPNAQNGGGGITMVDLANAGGLT